MRLTPRQADSKCTAGLPGMALREVCPAFFRNQASHHAFMTGSCLGCLVNVAISAQNAAGADPWTRSPSSTPSVTNMSICIHTFGSAMAMPSVGTALTDDMHALKLWLRRLSHANKQARHWRGSPLVAGISLVIISSVQRLYRSCFLTSGFRIDSNAYAA